MASIYKQSRRKPIPAGAKILERKGRRVAAWIDPKTGFKESAPLSDDGTAIVVEAKWYTIAYFDHTGKRLEATGRTGFQCAPEVGGDALRRSSLRAASVAERSDKR